MPWRKRVRFGLVSGGMAKTADVSPCWGPPAAPKPALGSKSFMMVCGPFVNPLRLPTTSCVGGLLILAVLAAVASAASNPPNRPHLLRTVAEVRALTLEQARQKYPIHLKGVITYRAPEYQVTFFQDATAGIYVFDQQSD